MNNVNLWLLYRYEFVAFRSITMLKQWYLCELIVCLVDNSGHYSRHRILKHEVNAGYCRLPYQHTLVL